MLDLAVDFELIVLSSFTHQTILDICIFILTYFFCLSTAESPTLSNFIKRRSDFYDDDVFINPDGTELPEEVHSGVDNAHMIHANQYALRSRDNIFEYRDTPSTKTLVSKVHTDTTSIRSPSSLATTHKSGSQSSLKSAISLKETNGGILTSNSSSARPSRLGTLNGTALTAQQSKTNEEKRLLAREPLTTITSTPLVATTATTTTINTMSLVPEVASSNRLKTAPNSSVTNSTTLTTTGIPSSRSVTPVPSARIHMHTTPPALASVPHLTSQGQQQPQARTQVIEGVPQTSV